MAHEILQLSPIVILASLQTTKTIWLFWHNGLLFIPLDRVTLLPIVIEAPFAIVIYGMPEIFREYPKCTPEMMNRILPIKECIICFNFLANLSKINSQ